MPKSLACLVRMSGKEEGKRVWNANNAGEYLEFAKATKVAKNQGGALEEGQLQD